MKHASVWTIATAEIRNSVRLMRTWTFTAIACFLVVTIYMNQMWVHSTASSISASAGDFGSRFLMGTSSYAMLLVFQIGIIFFAFDVRARDTRDRIAEVLDSRPFTNVDLLLGRLTGLVLLLVIPATTLIALLWIVSFFLYQFDAPLGDVIEPYSVLSFVVLDLVPNLAFWGALTIFLSVVLRLRAVVAVLMLGFAIALFVLSTELPKYLLDPLASVTALVLKPSDLAPQFMNGMILWQRLSLIILVAGFLFLSAFFYPRVDGSSKFWRLATGLGCLVVGVLIQGGGIVFSIKSSNEFDRLADVHRELSNQPRADIVHLSGSVQIDPGDELSVDYRIAFEPPDPDVHEHVFAFNPGFQILSLSLNEAQGNFHFEDGLLRIPSNTPSDGGKQELAISARGIPDTAFGYFDAPLNVNDAIALDRRALASLGVRNAVNHDEYVALMPGIKWYPTAGSAFREDDYRHFPQDRFTVDLEVTVPEGWSVAGPGSRETLQTGDQTRFRFAPRATVPEVGLFGARFVRNTMPVDGVAFELLMSPQHTRNIELFAEVAPVLKERVREMFSQARELGLSYPYEMLSVVEVPSSLRIYGGGWRMPSLHVLPGIFLIRETGFPIARFEARLDNATRTQSEEAPIAELQWELLATYFKNDLSGGNPFDSIPRNFFSYQTSASGKGAHALAYVTNALTTRLIGGRTGFFSVHFIGSPLGREVTEGTAVAAGQRVTTNRQITDQWRDLVVTRPQVWEQITATSLAEMDFSSEPELSFNALTLKGEAVADSLFDALGREEIGRLLRAIRDRYAGESFTFDDFRQITNELNIDIESTIGDWLNERELPGFKMSAPETVRLSDDELGVPAYQTTFYLANEKPVPGLVKLSYDVERGDETTTATNLLPPIQIEASSHSQVALHTEYAISRIRLHPYLSHNRETIQIDVDEPDTWDPQNIERLPLLSSVELQLTHDESIVVDDLDVGFSVSEDVWIPRRTSLLFWLEENLTGRVWSYERDFDQGLPIWGYISVLYTEAQRWHRRSKRNSWGEYRHTTAVAYPGSGSNVAHFTARLPSNGLWTLDYYFPVGREYSVGRETSRQLENVAQQSTHRDDRKVGKYSITIEDGERTIPIEFDVSVAPHGWNRLGTFSLEQRNVVVSISNLGEMPIYADAIRWKPAPRAD